MVFLGYFSTRNPFLRSKRFKNRDLWSKMGPHRLKIAILAHFFHISAWVEGAIRTKNSILAKSAKMTPWQFFNVFFADVLIFMSKTDEKDYLSPQLALLSQKFRFCSILATLDGIRGAKKSIFPNSPKMAPEWFIRVFSTSNWFFRSIKEGKYDLRAKIGPSLLTIAILTHFDKVPGLIAPKPDFRKIAENNPRVV